MTEEIDTIASLFETERYRCFVKATFDLSLINLMRTESATADNQDNFEVTISSDVSKLLSKKQIDSIIAIDEDLLLAARLTAGFERLNTPRESFNGMIFPESLEEMRKSDFYRPGRSALQAELDKSFAGYQTIYALILNKGKELLRVIDQYSRTDELGQIDPGPAVLKLSGFAKNIPELPEWDYLEATRALYFITKVFRLISKDGPPPSPKKNDGKKFETRCLELLESAGYTARLTPISDQGADIIAEREHLSFAIQCKSHQRPIGNKAVQEAAGARSYYQTDFACVVSCSGFTSSAQELASKADVLLVHENSLTKIFELSVGRIQGGSPI